MVKDDLHQIGLSDKEAEVYLAVLELGTDTVQNIAKKAKVKRPTTYVALKLLISKGLVSSVEKGKKSFFIAEDPEHLVRFLDQQIKNLDLKKDNIKPLLSELKLINNRSADKPVVRFFEGKEGLNSLNAEFYKEFSKEARSSKKSDEKLYLCYSRDLLNKVFTAEEIEINREVRVRADVESLPLYNSTQPPKDAAKAKGIKLNEIEFPFPCDIAVYKNKVRFISLIGKPSAILIEDKNLAQGLRSLFRLAYKGAQQE
ncbi:MAG: helix-turn-helix domain-containing protein [Candidatus Komeilibacteria bacterium]